MRLRGTVNAPQRLKDEAAYEEHPRQSLRRSRAPPPHQYVDYNPNLPPAAFPTLDEPRVPEKRDKKAFRQGNTTQRQDEPRREPQNRDSRIHNGSGRKSMKAEVDVKAAPDKLQEGWVLVDGNDRPISVSWVASNGDCNPIYTRNMDMMASADTPLHCDVEGSDYEMDHSPDGGGIKEAIPIHDPEWSDLSPRIQVEIADNLLQHYNWPTVVHVLGLTAKQCEKTQEYMTQREKQMDLEDAQLGRMRQKQLKALLKIDNSALKHDKSHKFVFRRASRQYGRRLSDAIKMDFFSCYPGELVNAKRFLDKRRIDTGYAGEWSDGIADWRTTEDENKYTVSETGSPLVNGFASMDGCMDGETPDFDLPASKRPHLNITIYPGQSKDIFERQGDPDLLRLCSIAHRDALLHPCIKPLKAVTSPLPIIYHLVEPMPSQSSTEKLAELVVRGNPVPVSTWLRDKLNKIGLEVEQGVSRSLEGKMWEDGSDDDWLSAFPLMKPEPMSFESHSQLTPPGRVILERNPDHLQADEQFMDFDDMIEIEENATDDGVMVDSSDSRPSSPSPSSLGFSDNVHSMTSYVETTPEVEVSDCESDEDEDEVVLVPTPTPSPTKELSMGNH
ncbi:hypothetical protein SI65_07689 [Aspergillus cristatus]|uniref:Uncharacterized protein n=1 Tax=Aspergillus cristatus TaxID=573508 RepID=A0A1E3B720_ASPCR|nr:hypothetical protein SI65_07689 [Aspergillus cristatus]